MNGVAQSPPPRAKRRYGYNEGWTPSLKSTGSDRFCAAPVKFFPSTKTLEPSISSRRQRKEASLQVRVNHDPPVCVEHSKALEETQQPQTVVLVAIKNRAGDVNCANMERRSKENSTMHAWTPPHSSLVDVGYRVYKNLSKHLHGDYIQRIPVVILLRDMHARASLAASVKQLLISFPDSKPWPSPALRWCYPPRARVAPPRSGCPTKKSGRRTTTLETSGREETNES